MGKHIIWIEPKSTHIVNETEKIPSIYTLQIEHIQSVGVNIVNVPLCSALKCAYESYTTIMRAEAAWVHRKALAKGEIRACRVASGKEAV